MTLSQPTKWPETGQPAPGAYWPTPGHRGPSAQWSTYLELLMTNQQLFIELIHRLGDYEESMVLQLLLAWRADQAPVRSGKRKIHEQFPEALTVRGVERAVARLIEQDLITTRVYPNTYTEFRVNVEALEVLLSEPIPATKCFPGISTEPIHYLTTKAERLAQQASKTGLHAMTPAASGQDPDVPTNVAPLAPPATTGVVAEDSVQPSNNVEKQP
jgi:hypothetical protein